MFYTRFCSFRFFDHLPCCCLVCIFQTLSELLISYQRLPRPCYLNSGEFIFIILIDRFCSPKMDLNLGPSRTAVLEDGKATALTTQKPGLVVHLGCICEIFVGKQIFLYLFSCWYYQRCLDTIKGLELTQQDERRTLMFSQNSLKFENINFDLFPCLF